MQLQKQQQQKLLQQQQTSPDNGTILSTLVSNTPSTPVSSTTVTTATTDTNGNTKETLDETHSDDSGFSTSSSPVNGTPAIEKKYIRPNGYNIIPSPPPQKLLIRTMSTPQIFQPQRRFTFNPSQKGIMQRFISTRGKMIAAQQQQKQQNSANSNKDNQIINNNNNSGGIGIGNSSSSSSFISPTIIIPPIIERDADGRPIRRGYIPVEEKIQKELRDLKNRETELKRIRKLSSRQSQPDLLESLEDE